MTANNKYAHLLLGALLCCGALSQTNCMQPQKLSEKEQKGLWWRLQDNRQKGIPSTGNAQSFASDFMKKNWPKGNSTAGTVERDLANLRPLIITKPDMFRFPKRQNSIYQQANANLVRALLSQQAPKRWHVALTHHLLFVALANNYLHGVQVALNAGVNPNLPNTNGDTPLTLACYVGNLEITKLLLEHGAKPNVPNANGYTPLTLACRFGDLETAKLLLLSGAKPNVPDVNGETPLMPTCYDGNLKLAKLLLSSGADPNVRNKCGKTPLWFACRYGYLEIAKLLLEKGANPNVPNSNNEMPLMLTCWSGHLEIAKLLLLYKADPNVLDKTGWNALEVACLHDNLELVTLLLSRQANLPTSLYSGWTLAIQRRIQLVADWTNRQGNQPVTQQEFEQFIQHPGDFATLLFRRNGLLTKIMNTLTEQQRTRLITIFFEHISGRERRAYLAPDIERITKTIISFK